MQANIIICVKQVPHPESLGRVTLNPATGTIQREGVPAVINPNDRNALEEALKICERLTGRTTVLTVGPTAARKVLEEALAMGVDDALHLCDPAFAGADTLATSQALACAISKLAHFDLILCGDTTIDSGTGQVAVQLAEILGLPAVTNVEEITIENERSAIVKRAWERGHIRVRLKLPAVIAVTNKINQPRLPNILNIMAATQKEIKCWNAAEAEADHDCVGSCGSPTRTYRISEFHSRRQGKILKGPPEEVVGLAFDGLVKLGII